ncbi:MAG: threonine/serine exporter family protein, partial [Plesiomonas sp.]
MHQDQSAEAERQREITRLCVQSALLLLQHGAESTLVEQVAERLGLALGVQSVESSISANAIVLSTLNNGQCITTTRRN